MKENVDNKSGAAVILAAGEGMRMRPLTLIRPKPLLPVLGKPLFGVIAEKVLRWGVNRIFANIYHLPRKMEEYAGGKEWPLRFIREKNLMGTGGGIGNMADRLGSYRTILLHNGDVISDFDFTPAVEFHEGKNALVTMILHNSPPPSVTLDSRGEVTAIGTGGGGGREDEHTAGYTGISVISSEALEYFPSQKVYSLVEILLNMIEQEPGSVWGYHITGEKPGHLWAEIGSLEGYLDLHRRILVDKLEFDTTLSPPPLPFNLAEESSVHPSTRWNGFLQVGAGAVIEKDCHLSNCVVLENSTVTEGSSISNAVISPRGVLKEEK